MVIIDSLRTLPENSNSSTRIALRPGKCTIPFLELNPALKSVPEAVPTLSIINPERKSAILGFAGFAISHYEAYFKNYAPEFANRTPHATAIAEWGNVTDVPELRWRLIVDYMLEHHPEGLNMFGTSFGGFETLRGLQVIKKIQDEGVEVPFINIGLVVAPTSGESIKKSLSTKVFIQLSRLESALAQLTNNVSARLLSKSLKEMNTPLGRISMGEARAIMIKLRTLQNSPPLTGESLPANLKVDYFGTDKSGHLDPLVVQPIALKELRSAGVEVNEHWYEPNPQFAHVPSEADTFRLLDDMVKFFS